MDIVNKKYEDDDAFFSVVNNHSLELKADRLLKSKVEEYFPCIEKAIENSIACTDRKIEFEKQPEINRKKKKKELRNVVLAISLAITLLVPTAVKIIDSVKQQLVIQEVVDKKIFKAKDDLLKYGCAVLDYQKKDLDKNGPFTLLDNTTANYSRLPVDGIDDIFVYREILPEDEFSDFIQAVKYTTSDGTYNFLNFDQVLSVYGFENETQFENYSEGIILQKHLNNEYNSDISNSRGGK